MFYISTFDTVPFPEFQTTIERFVHGFSVGVESNDLCTVLVTFSIRVEINGLYTVSVTDYNLMVYTLFQ